MKQIIFSLILVFGFGLSAFAQNVSSNCATIEVTGGGVVENGEPMYFTAKVTGLAVNSTLEYEWKVSAGTISSGQGTASIMIDTTGLSDMNITAEVKIKSLSGNCPNTASQIGSVQKKLEGCHFDAFGKLSKYDVFARIQNLYVELNNYPNAQGYIINYGTETEAAARERQIQRAIKFLDLDANRLTMVRGGANARGAGVWSVVWIVPPGVEFPTPVYNE